MGSSILTLILIWGVWLLVPIITDGMATLWQIVISLLGIPYFIYLLYKAKA